MYISFLPYVRHCYKPEILCAQRLLVTMNSVSCVPLLDGVIAKRKTKKQERDNHPHLQSSSEF